jgi:HPt (histidine-containing phosphotransfer) domain-containing protein
MPRFNYDFDFFIEMLGDVVAHLPERIQEMKSACLAQDADCLHRSAHNLKGLAANFGASGLTELARTLETNGREGDLSQAEALIAGIEAEIPRLQAFYQELQDRARESAVQSHLPKDTACPPT